MNFNKLISALKNKKAEVFQGTFICVMIIIIGFTLMSLTFLVNTHYKVTREMEHCLTLLQTSAQKDMYDSLESYNPTLYQGKKAEFQERYFDYLQDTDIFEYDEANDCYIGPGFVVRDVSLDYTIPSGQYEADSSGFTVNYTVNATIDYTYNTVFLEDPVKITTGSIDFTSVYEFVNDESVVSGVEGAQSDSSKYGNK